MMRNVIKYYSSHCYERHKLTIYLVNMVKLILTRTVIIENYLIIFISFRYVVDSVYTFTLSRFATVIVLFENIATINNEERERER